MESSSRGFFASLYDLSFDRFITPSIVRVVYIIALALVFVWALMFLLVGFAAAPTFLGNQQPDAGTVLFHLIGAVVMFVVGSIAVRINLEFVMAVFRIAENTESLRHGGSAGSGVELTGGR